MTLSLRSIADRGDLRKERLTLRCAATTDIGDYVLLKTETRDGVPTTAVDEVIWFPNKTVEAGDLVVVYTKSGSSSEKVLTTGKKAHFVYWGSQTPFWADDSAAAVLLHAPKWEAKLAAELARKVR